MLHLLPLLSTATSRRSRTAQESARGKICAGKGSVSAGDEGMLQALPSAPRHKPPSDLSPAWSVPKLSVPTGSPVAPQLVAFQGQTLSHQKSRGAERDVPCSLERSWRQGAAWFPASKTPRLDTNGFGHPRKDALHTSANPTARTQLFSIFPAPTQPRLVPGSGALTQEPDRSSTSACSRQRVPAASEPPGSQPSRQPQASPGRAGKPKH